MPQRAVKILQNGSQPGGLEPKRSKIRGRCPAEHVARLAAAQIVAGQRGGPGEAVVEPDLVLQPLVTVNVLDDECQRPGREIMPELLGEFPGQGGLGGLAQVHPATGQVPVIEAFDGAQQDVATAGEDRRHPQVEDPQRTLPGDVACRRHWWVPPCGTGPAWPGYAGPTAAKPRRSGVAGR